MINDAHPLWGFRSALWMYECKHICMVVAVALISRTLSFCLSCNSNSRAHRALASGLSHIPHKTYKCTFYLCFCFAFSLIEYARQTNKSNELNRKQIKLSQIQCLLFTFSSILICCEFLWNNSSTKWKNARDDRLFHFSYSHLGNGLWAYGWCSLLLHREKLLSMRAQPFWKDSVDSKVIL